MHAPGAITLVSYCQALPCRSFQHSEKPTESRHWNITGIITQRACPVRQLFAFHTETCPWATGNVRCPRRIYIGWTVVHTPLKTGVSSVHEYRMHYLSLLYTCEVSGGVISTATGLRGGRNRFRILVRGRFPVSKTRPYFAAYSAPTLTFRHRASRILGQAFHYSPENAFYIFNQQIYFIIWYLLDRASFI